MTLEEKLQIALEALEFYADPGTYFAIGIFPDRPCGEFVDDFSETEELGSKPGRRAREAWDKIFAESEKMPEQVEENKRLRELLRRTVLWGESMYGRLVSANGLRDYDPINWTVMNEARAELKNEPV